jgi:hypothetical protein
MIGKRLFTAIATLGLTAGLTLSAVPPAGAAIFTCLHGQVGTFAASNSPIFVSNSFDSAEAGLGHAGDTFQITQINPGSIIWYRGSDINNGIAGWVTNTELTNIHCLQA